MKTNFGSRVALRTLNFKLKILFVLLFLFAVKLAGQDVLFSNYLNTPMQTNPALAAFDNDLKIGLGYRGRVSKFNQSYNTPVLSVICPLINQEQAKRWGGIGFSLLSDMSDNTNMLTTTGANFAFAYNVQINKFQTISASLGAGFYRRQIDLNKLTTGSQYDPSTGFDPGLPINETLTGEAKGFMDLFTGVVWQLYDITGKTKVFAGVSAFHLNKPNVSLNSQDDALALRYGFQTGFRILENKKIIIYPNSGIDYQSNILRYNIGFDLTIPFVNSEQSYLNDASLCFTPRYISDKMLSVGMEFRKASYIISFIYDFNFGNNMVNSNMSDAYEINICYKKTLFKPKRQKKKIIVDENYIVGQDRVFNNNPEVIVIKDTLLQEDTTLLVEKEWKEKIDKPDRKITFNYKSDKVEDEAKDVLNEIIAYLKTNQDYVLEIEGHTDNIGDAESNKRYSLSRAQSISNYLVKNGILPSRIRVMGRGETKPIATNATEEGRAKNRRVEFRLYRVVK
jgi:type IX secretion system PorP/SprF family membrane protein